MKLKRLDDLIRIRLADFDKRAINEREKAAFANGVASGYEQAVLDIKEILTHWEVHSSEAKDSGDDPVQGQQSGSVPGSEAL